MANLNFGGVMEEVVTRDEFPLKKAQEVLKDEVVAVLGYGVQGPGQALNLQDNGIKVIIGQRKNSKSWDKAVQDGWIPGKTLFELEEAAEKATIIMYLLSDAGQKVYWPELKPNLTKGKALYFSHGFSITYKDLTDVIPPKDVDVILIAPKGSGLSVRRNFIKGSGINSSFAVYQDATGRAKDRCLALGIGIGSSFIFPTTFEREVYGDLTGERGVLLGAIAGIIEAQYYELRKNGHTPSEAFNESVEELTQWLATMLGEKGLDGLLSVCSTTAQRGALDWKGRFRSAVSPVFADLYRNVADGTEAKIVLDKNSKPDYREKLDEELSVIHNEEIWQTGQQIRKLRPENLKKPDNA